MDRALVLIAALLLAASTFAVGYLVAQDNARYAAFNVGEGRIYRLDTESGQLQLFDADCDPGQFPPLPKGARLIHC